MEFCTFFSTAFLASTSHSLFVPSFQCIHCKKMCFSFILLGAVVFLSFPIYPANIYLFKLNNRNNRKSGNICSKFTVDLVSLLLNLNIFHTFYYFYSWLWACFPFPPSFLLQKQLKLISLFTIIMTIERTLSRSCSHIRWLPSSVACWWRWS